jgi:hypothetical protein
MSRSLRIAKQESSYEADDAHTTQVKCKPNEDMTFVAVMSNVLTTTETTQINSHVQKLEEQGITDSSALKVFSKRQLEQTLINQGFNLGEMADVMKVWVALQTPKKGGHTRKGAYKGRWKGSKGSRNHRSRSPKRGQRPHQHRGRDSSGAHEERLFSKASLGGRPGRSLRDDEPPPQTIRADDVDDKGSKGSRNHRSRTPKRGQRPYKHRGRGACGAHEERLKASLGGRPGRSSRNDEPPPLFAAIRAGNDVDVERQIVAGAPVNQRHQGWTPLMVASELGLWNIAFVLLEKCADVNATNRKGRCALSFAAAPSQDNVKKEQRESATDLIELLITFDAKKDRKDVRGMTPRDYAEAESRAPKTCDPRLRRAEAAKMLALH